MHLVNEIEVAVADLDQTILDISRAATEAGFVIHGGVSRAVALGLLRKGYKAPPRPPETPSIVGQTTIEDFVD